MTGAGLLLGLPPARYPGAGPHEIVDTARAAENAGFGGVVVSEHLVMGNRLDRYPWGNFPEPADAPWLEPLTTLAAIGSATTDLRLATGILIAPLRSAAVLAKSAATVAVMTNGRLELGVGTGWQQEEFDAVGVDYEDRGRLLDETIAACRALWGSGPASFSAASVSFTDVWCEPRPVGMRVLFSGTLTRRNVNRIVTLGDGWIPIMGMEVAEVLDGARQLQAAFRQAGRDPHSLRVRAHSPIRTTPDGRPDLPATLDQAAQLGAEITDVVVPLAAFVRCAEDLGPFFAAAASHRDHAQ